MGDCWRVLDTADAKKLEEYEKALYRAFSKSLDVTSELVFDIDHTHNVHSAGC